MRAPALANPPDPANSAMQAEVNGSCMHGGIAWSLAICSGPSRAAHNCLGSRRGGSNRSWGNAQHAVDDNAKASEHMSR
eukprot:564458-Pyramimonas_sp.AAC.1